MSPELKKLLEKFNLDNYADCENLTLADWYTQIQFRELVGTHLLPFTKAIPELLKCPLRPEGLYTDLSHDPPDKKPGLEEIPSWMISNLELMPEMEVDAHKYPSLIRMLRLQVDMKQMIKVNFLANDEQIFKEFKQYIKAKRETIGKFFPEKQKRSWIDYKILPYIDICLMAMSIENPSVNKSIETPSPLITMENVRKNISYQEIAYLLFKEEIDNNRKLLDGQRIRLTCKPAVQKIIHPVYISMLRHHALIQKETHFIKGYDSIWMQYDEYEELCRGARHWTEFFKKDERIANWKKTKFLEKLGTTDWDKYMEPVIDDFMHKVKPKDAKN